MKLITARDLLDGDPPAEDAAVTGAELTRLYWSFKQGRLDLARRERYWASINEALVGAYEELETRTRELQSLREELERLNLGLERRVSEQVTEIVQRASEIDALNTQLRQKVGDRSRELRRALDRAAGGAEPVSLAPGTVIGGRARVIGKLGESATGSVYEVEDLMTNRVVALKMLHAVQRESIRRFVTEAGIASTLTHPAIVQTLHVDITEEDGTPYQLMELVRGVTLRRFASAVRVRFGDAARIGAAVAAALVVAHSQGVVHRDIKPDNLMLSIAPPGVRLLDFGIAKVLNAPAEGDATRPLTFHGTPGYMAPDQIRPEAGITPAVDIYSLGVVLFELIVGRRPFVESRIEDVLLAHLYSPVPTLGGPPELSSLVMACLEKQPGARPAATDLVEQLTAFADRMEAPSVDDLGRSSVEAVEAAETKRGADS
ncbi:MAG: protein kinase [Labilithrix sp.]